MSTVQGAQTQIGYITEVTPGVTPATPAIYYLPFKSFTPNLSIVTIEDTTIQSHRQDTFTEQGNKSINGELDAPLFSLGASPVGHQGFGPFFESAMQSGWITNVLKIGNTEKTFTIEKRLQDLAGVNSYFRYKGMACTGFTITSSAASNETIGVKYTFSGLDQDPLTSTALTGLVTTNSLFPTTANQIVASNIMNDFKVDGGSELAIATAVTIDFKNNSMYNYVLGSKVASSISFSKAKVTGTLTCYFTSITQYNLFIGDAYHVIEAKFGEGTKSHTFKMSRVKFGTATQVINNMGTAIVTLPFVANWNSTDSSALVITRAG